GGSVVVETSIAARAGSRAACVVIQDTGEGMPPERLARIFEPFFTTRSAGTGLGLAIARKAIEGHGGGIRVDSEPGIGTTVTMTVPLTPMIASVLIIEDEAVLAGAMRDYLARRGFEASVAPSGEAALETLKQADVDLIVLDHHLPGMDGVEV